MNIKIQALIIECPHIDWTLECLLDFRVQTQFLFRLLSWFAKLQKGTFYDLHLIEWFDTQEKLIPFN